MRPKARELDQHLRKFFPDLVVKLKEEGKYEEHLRQGAETWARVYQQAVERGLSHIQAAEVAREAVFPKPEPFQRPSAA